MNGRQPRFAFGPTVGGRACRRGRRSHTDLTVCPSRARRRGVAAVEFAVCLPMIILLVFGSIEASSFIFLKQSLNAAAYEGVREAIRLGSDSDAGTERATAILNARGVSDFVIEFPSGDAGAADRGDAVVITVSAPTGSNRPITGQLLSDRTLVARVVMVKE